MSEILCINNFENEEKKNGRQECWFKKIIFK